MAISKIDIEEFLSLSKGHALIDVRSPGEYLHAHIPSAHNLALFSDEERKIVGTLYKQQGKQKAIKAGLDFFGVKMKLMIEQVEAIKKNSESNIVLVHCWRGGMRSAGVAWLLDLYGYEVYTLIGGYKAFRNWVLQQFEKKYTLAVLGGYTGSAKTETLIHLKNKPIAIIDLEGLAHHKGSAFGGIGQPKQPSQEMFENRLSLSLEENRNHFFMIEDESQRIGNLNIPHAFWNHIRTAPLYFMEIPFEERLQHIIANYGYLEKDKLITAILRIQKRLGPNETKTTINYLLENKIEAAFTILLKYYDKEYVKALEKRDNIKSLLQKIPLEKIDVEKNALALLSIIK